MAENIKLPWSKRASTWLNLASGLAGLLMTQAGSMGLPPQTAGWVQVLSAMFIACAQVYNQGAPKQGN